MKITIFLLIFWYFPNYDLAQLSYNTAGTVYSQNFDGLPNSGSFSNFQVVGDGPFNLNSSPFNAVNMDGWQILKLGGNSPNLAFTTNKGLDNNSGVYSYGVIGSTNRALGSLPSKAGNYAFGLVLTNNTGSKLNAFTVSFTAEQWRNGGSKIVDTWYFKYKTGTSISSINQSGFTTNAALNFSSIISSSNAADLDGTLASNQVYKSYTITGISWNIGEQLILRWEDEAVQNSDGMAIDNFSFAAYPASSKVYSWAAGSTGTYSAPESWIPVRNSTATSDILLFNTPGTIIVDNVPTENIKQLVLSNGSNVTLQNKITSFILSVNDFLNVNSGSALSIGTNCKIDIASTAVVNLAGSFKTGNALTFHSDKLNTASLGLCTGTLTGNVIVERFIPAQRAYRLLSHPFSGNITLNSLLPFLDITGPKENGFTSNAGNNPSAFSYEPLTDEWLPYTNAAANWSKGQGLLLFIRGKNGEGLTGPNEGFNTYPGGGPSDVKIALSGQLNTGNVDYQTSNSNTWNLVGNPYTTSIDITKINNLITTAGGTNAFVYVWDPNSQQTFKAVKSGAYVAKQLNNPVIIPTGAAFFVKNTSGASRTLTFTDQCKTLGQTALSLFGFSKQQGFSLVIEKEDQTWDQIRLVFNKNYSPESTDSYDLDKFENTSLNFYSISSDDKRLAVDNRPLPQRSEDSILLGIQSNLYAHFTLKVQNWNMDTHTVVYLYDNWLNTITRINETMYYDFEVTDDPHSSGDRRFRLVFKNEQVHIIEDVSPLRVLRIQPNPASDHIQIFFPEPTNSSTMIKLINESGNLIKSIKPGANQYQIQIPLSGLAKGIYLVQVLEHLQTTTQKIIIL